MSEPPAKVQCCHDHPNELPTKAVEPSMSDPRHEPKLLTTEAPHAIPFDFQFGFSTVLPKISHTGNLRSNNGPSPRRLHLGTSHDISPLRPNNPLLLRLSPALRTCTNCPSHRPCPNKPVLEPTSSVQCRKPLRETASSFLVTPATVASSPSAEGLGETNKAPQVVASNTVCTNSASNPGHGDQRRSPEKVQSSRYQNNLANASTFKTVKAKE